MSLVRLRRGLAVDWAEVNPILTPGEPGVELDSLRVKVGDGVTRWNVLPYVDAHSGKQATTVGYAATVTPNANTTDVLNIGILSGSLTMATPTGSPVDGQNLRVRFQQDGAGGRILTYSSGYVFGTDVYAGLDPTAAGARWERLFTFYAPDGKWRAVAIVRGF